MLYSTLDSLQHVQMAIVASDSKLLNRCSVLIFTLFHIVLVYCWCMESEKELCIVIYCSLELKAEGL